MGRNGADVPLFELHETIMLDPSAQSEHPRTHATFAWAPICAKKAEANCECQRAAAMDNWYPAIVGGAVSETD